MAPAEVKAFFRTQIESVGNDYLKDLDVMSAEQLGDSPGGKARTPYDVTYEVSLVNKRIAKRLRGEDPGPWVQAEGWVTAPADFQSKEKAAAAIRDSINEVLAAWDALPEADLTKTIKTPTGQTHPIDLAFMCAYHTGYHDAQLNYLQSVHGDDEEHW